MASGISKALGKAAESYAKEIEQEENKKILTALDKTMKRVEEKLDEFLTEYMVQAYYDGYDQIKYKRSYQLGNAVKSFTNSYSMGSSMGFKFGVVFDESKMDHSSYTIKAKWYRKRKKQWVSKEYTVTPKKHKPNELKILEFFQEGIHPNAVSDISNAMPLFTDDKEGSVPELVEAWVENGGIVDIFLKELEKLH